MQTNLNISQNGVYSLSIIKKWTYFLSICGFIFSGLMILFGIIFAAIGNKLSGMNAESPFPSFLFLIIYSALGVLYYIPSFYLYKFSTIMKIAVELGTEQSIEESFKYLRSFFKFSGVLTIIMIALFFLSFVIGILAALLMPTPPNTINS